MYYKLLKLKFIILHTINQLINLKLFFKSRAFKKELLKINKTFLTDQLNTNGYTYLNDSFALPDEIIKKCDQIISSYDENSKDLNKNKSMIFNILKPNDIPKIDGLIEFATSKKLISIIFNYLNEVPILLGINLYLSPKNENEQFSSSQLFHLDMEQHKQIKIFYLLHDTDVLHGPLEFMDKLKTKNILKSINYSGKRISDETIRNLNFSNSCKNDKTFIGKRGSGLMIDSSNCLHRGSRKITKNRYILQFQYFSKFSSYKSYKNKMNLNLDKYSDFTKFLLH